MYPARTIEYKAIEYKPIIRIPELGYVDDICILLTIDDFEDVDQFIIEYIKRITIHYEGEILHETNGLILTCLNSLNNNKFAKCISLNLQFKPWSSFVIEIHTQLNENLKYLAKMEYVIRYTNIDTSKLCLDTNLIKYNRHNCQRIRVEPWEISHTCKLSFYTYAKYFLIYLDDNIKVENIALDFNSIRLDFTNLDMGNVLPYLCHVGPLEKNMLFIPFMNDTELGIDLRRIDHIDLIFRFKKNTGGDIYIINESVQFASKPFLSLNYSFIVDDYIGNKFVYEPIQNNGVLEICI